MKMTIAMRMGLIFGVLIGTAEARAQSPAPSQPSNRNGSRVLDFDADVIEGERQRPDFLFQTGTPGVSLDSLLFGRKDFNDFLKVDKKRRPTYVAPASRKAPR